MQFDSSELKIVNENGFLKGILIWPERNFQNDKSDISQDSAKFRIGSIYAYKG
ncbi:hypothetical protein LEP1GSC043_1353 [Leptospira weilii str. Ecochallenge]|uniref:Uncharacterized protein n=2 Tax=Leptospira weilii TaxID=28184 RepID=N1U6D2_9LEPT|nr:hypothetical protein LEP1GSC108_1825 [Leptospira weilii str. UI 13098]EMY13716.1 hypothetical protein LEP1GSC043_1353 [Leptospira weilii str. Ecochallenge]